MIKSTIFLDLILFRASVVSNYSTFWVNEELATLTPEVGSILSPVVTVPALTTVTTSPPQVTGTDGREQDLINFHEGFS